MNEQEQNYLNLMKNILENGIDKPNRTGMDSRSLTGTQLRFTLTKNTLDCSEMVLPLLTTKFVSFKLIATELLWFIKAGHNSQDLASQGNHIWDPNGSREYLDKNGFQDRPTGELGAVYGTQWRHFGGSWQDEFKTKKGIDQIANLINGILQDPYGRRHIVTAWNPEQLHEAALPACHLLWQMVIRPRDRKDKSPFWIDCVVTIRSNDFPLGNPYNIASYALLTHIIANLTNLQAGELIINMGDCHIYHNQIPGCEIQLQRVPKPFPTLLFTKKWENIDEIDFQDFKVLGYDPYSAIKFPFSV